MLLFIEGYPYELDAIVKDGLSIREILKDVVSIPVKEDNYAFGYVGYCYSKTAKDVIFFLPKVVLTGEHNDENVADTIFGATPQDIIDFNSDSIKLKFTEEGCKEYKEFLSTLSIWIYRTISVYKETHDDNILESKEYQGESRGKKVKHNTLLDVIIALRDFNKNNQDYFTFIAKNIHSGFNKIQWQKTITSTNPIFLKGQPIYSDPVNRKKMVNFDEELLVIFFSILNYIREEHGFSFDINIHYQLISPEKIKRSYIDKNLGCRRLKQIKYKYFSDKALRIWDLCYAFFDREYKISINRQAEDFLLAKNFNLIFEAMIDTLISGEDKQKLPKELTDQRDGKLVDHMFIGQGLIEQSNLPAELTYYLGDSKYYKRSKDDTTVLGDKSIYKQYTYAKNVIQWNMNLFLDDNDDGEQPQLRDSLTEGYNPIPNFFISAKLNQELSYKDVVEITDKRNTHFSNSHFENRLFDRDTLLICHYDVNFLYVISLYARNNNLQKDAWKKQVRDKFRTEIQRMLTEQYSFYAMQAHPNIDAKTYLKEHFQQTLGKIFTPFGNDEIFSLALDKEDPEGNNEELLAELRKHFFVVENGIGENPSEPLSAKIEAEGHLYQTDPSIDKSEECVLTGYIPKNEREFENFNSCKGKYFDMKYIPTINLMAVKYFMPMVDGFVDGYYKVKSMSFKTVKEQSPDGQEKDTMFLHLSLGDYIKLGEDKVFFYRVKMTAGQLHSISKIEEDYTM